MVNNPDRLNFDSLTTAIRKTHEHMAAQAGQAVNISLTLRNWTIGHHIIEYEQTGQDRAEYGNQVLELLSKTLQDSLDRCYSSRYLRLCRQLYVTYPQIRKSLISRFDQSGNRKSLISKLPDLSVQAHSNNIETLFPQLLTPEDKLVGCLSFTHFVELIKLDDPLKRSFYEIESIRGNWSVRELKRQIGSLYYERSGLSENKEKLAELAQSGVEKREPKLAIRDPYVFEFLGIKSSEVMRESDLEDQLLDKLQDFLLELGHGFCFEARQKRILIGDTHGFIDLVFYHRILKCHVLVELKVDSFNHENLGQLNTYVNWYRKNMMTDSDNPPVGILLCTQKDRALVEYALAGMDNHLFVSRYQLELPHKKEIQRVLEEKMREVSDGE
jgi:predicted nuclease of restriction endonuclease-like (RecB) superfamily